MLKPGFFQQAVDLLSKIEPLVRDTKSSFHIIAPIITLTYKLWLNWKVVFTADHLPQQYRNARHGYGHCK